VVDLVGVFTDVDIATNEDEFGFEVSSGETLATYSLEGSPGTETFGLRLTLLENQNGEEVLSVKATDREGKFATAIFSLTVTPVNDGPMVEGVIPDVTVEEDGPEVVVDLVGVFTDVDIETNGDQLSYAVIGGETFLTSSSEGDQLKLILLENQSGTEVLLVTATDAEGLSVNTQINLVINPVNDVPVAADDVVLAKQNDTTIVSSLDLLVNDEDVDAEDELKVILVDQVRGAEVILNADGHRVFFQCRHQLVELPPVSFDARQISL